MSNRALWNVRLKHESLGKPLKKKRIKRRQRLRIGLEQALQRRAKKLKSAPSDASAS